jgi:hypothetical protein
MKVMFGKPGSEFPEHGFGMVEKGDVLFSRFRLRLGSAKGYMPVMMRRVGHSIHPTTSRRKVTNEGFVNTGSRTLIKCRACDFSGMKRSFFPKS